MLVKILCFFTIFYFSSLSVNEGKSFLVQNHQHNAVDSAKIMFDNLSEKFNKQKFDSLKVELNSSKTIKYNREIIKIYLCIVFIVFLYYVYKVSINNET